MTTKTKTTKTKTTKTKTTKTKTTKPKRRPVKPGFERVVLYRDFGFEPGVWHQSDRAEGQSVDEDLADIAAHSDTESCIVVDIPRLKPAAKVCDNTLA